MAASRLAPRVGDDAKSAVLITALHDADKRGDGFCLRLAVENVFLDRGFAAAFLGGIHDLLLAAGEQSVDVFAGSMKFLGAEHEVHIREPIDQFLPTALGHAAHETEALAGLALAGVADERAHLVD
ncbi:MAG: hypothetical protein AAF441_24260, partial [Pseudomonadota bacterium]